MGTSAGVMVTYDEAWDGDDGWLDRLVWELKGSSREALVRALGRAGFVETPDDPSGHTMRRRPAAVAGRPR